MNNQDWQRAPDYDYFVREREGEGTKTYQVLMILGSPHYGTVANDGQQLSPENQQKEQHQPDGPSPSAATSLHGSAPSE